MASDNGESTSTSSPSQIPLTSGNGGNSDAGNFECNICFDLAQDPILTLCGHLFCWPCLYKWLQFHSQSHECPVCKAQIQEEKLVPLYGRGKTSTDPRSRSVPGDDIPKRPAGQRPETAHPLENDYHFPQPNLGFMGGLGGSGHWGGAFLPMAVTMFGNFRLSPSLGGLLHLPQLFNFQILGFPSTPTYGAGSRYTYGHADHHYSGAHPHVHPHHPSQGQQANNLKLFVIAIGAFVLLTLIST